MKLLSTISIFLLFQTVNATDTNLFFSNLTTREGLSNNTINCIFQDSRGFLWFGTNDGLNLYDGYEFRIFSNNSDDTKSIAGNLIFKIQEDKDGNLWIATNTGIDLYYRDKMLFKHIPFIEKDNYTFYRNYTRDLLIDTAGDVFTASASDVFKFDTLKKGFVRFLADIPEYQLFQKDGIETFIIDREKRLWIGSKTFGLFAYDLANSHLISSPVKKTFIDVKDKIYSVIEHKNGDIWMGTEQGVYRINSDLSEIKKIVSGPGVGTIHNVLKIYTDSEGRLWFGTDDGVLILYNTEDNIFKRFVSDELSGFNITKNSIRAIYEDEQGILWTGTYQGGINYALLNNNKQFYFRKNVPGYPDYMTPSAVAAIFEDSNGNLWIGKDGTGLDCYNPVTKKYKHYANDPENPNTISGNAILTITEDSKGQIWIGGYLVGVNMIDVPTGKITRYMHDPDNINSLSNDDVRDIYVDSSGYIWIATNGGGVDKFNPVAGKFTHFKEEGYNSISSNWCLKIFEDSHGYLWIGTYAGLSRYDRANNTFVNFRRNDEQGSISNDWIYTIAEDNSGNMWIGTMRGLNFYNREKNSFSRVLQSDSLPSDVINGLLFDSENNLWISTNRGISKYSPKYKTVKNYDQSDGLQGDQFIHGSYFKNKSGMMFFGGFSGYNYFYPVKIGNNSYIPPVRITNLLIFYNKVKIDQEGSPLTKSITETDKIILNHKQSLFTFRYTGLNYLNPEKNQYAYQLAGFDQDWNHVGTRREATFTNLNPGTYVFRVKASNNDGIWNERGASITVVILPPWWKTLSFRIMVVVLIIIITISVYYFRVLNLQKQKMHFERLLKIRTHEIEEKNNELIEQASMLNETNTILEEHQQFIEEQSEQLSEKNKELNSLNITKNKFFSIIAHDLKNPFSSLLGISEMLMKEYDELDETTRKQYVELITRSSQKIYKLLDNLLQWAGTQTSKLHIKKEVFNINEIVAPNIELLKDNITEKGIGMEITIPGGTEVVADRNMIDTVFRNIISNAVKFTEKGKIKVEAFLKKSFWEIRVTDSGTGISDERLRFIFEIDQVKSTEGTRGESGTGLGLVICKEFVEKNGGNISIDSIEGMGTVTRFTLPANIAKD